jgi:hypothetical protein
VGKLAVEAQSTADEIAGRPTVGRSHCHTDTPKGPECEQVVGQLVIVASAEPPLTGTSYNNWHEPTVAEAADVADAVVNAL